MFNTPRKVTYHASKRCAQRGIAVSDLDMVIEHGDEYTQSGSTGYFMGVKACARAKKSGINLRNLKGVVVIVAADGCIVTTYKASSPKHLRSRRR
jgi:hypothetical protein